jgi:hypothetical protein
VAPERLMLPSGGRAPAFAAVHGGVLSCAALLGLRGGSGRQRIARAAVTAVTVGTAILVVTDFVIAPVTGRFSGLYQDFGPILIAGRAANAGTDPYALFVPLASTTLVAHLGFDYLPVIALLARPLAAMPYQVAATLWLWVLLAATVAGSVITARTALPDTWPREAIGFAAGIAFAPAIYNLWNGQINALVLLSVAVAFRAWVRGDQVSCGVALGLGGVAKLAPAALLLLLVARRWWRGVIAAAAVAVAALAVGIIGLGFGRTWEWISQVLPTLERADGWYLNQSVGALISRLANHNVAYLQPTAAWLQGTITVASVACLLGAAAAVRRGPTTVDRRTLEFSAGVVAMVLAGSIGWWDDYASLLVPLLALGGLAARGALARPLTLAAAAAFLVVGVVTPAFLALGGNSWLPGTHGTAWWWPALQLDSLPAWSVVGLLIVLGATLLRWGSVLAPRARGAPT